MPGNREAYNQAMNNGHGFAWDRDWTSAIKAYSEAIREFPEDAEAHIHLGLALLELGRLADSLKVYTRARQLAPNDPIPLEKSADVLERMGRLKEAAQQYINVAEVYLAQRDLDKAIDNWERATRLTPGLISIHGKLAQAFERIGDNKRAVREYLMLAFNFQRNDEPEKAMKAAQRAQRLDRKNPQVLNTIKALETGGTVVAPEEIKDEEASGGAVDIFGDSPRQDVGEADPRGPIGEAMDKALGDLAVHVMEGGDLDAAGGNALQAMELQRQEQVEEAIAAYLRAMAKVKHPALFMNLGALMVKNDRSEEAVPHLDAAAKDATLAAGAYHALGTAHFNLKKYKQASRYLIQSLQLVDTSLAMDQTEVQELNAVYERLLQTLNGRTDEVLAKANDRFLKLMTGADWKQRIAETRRQLEEIMRDQGEQIALEMLTAERGTELTDIVSQIDRHIRAGKLILAMDMAHRAVEASPTYLPVHVRMAEILMREGRVRQAIDKYNVVAKSYMTRDENARAAAILSEVLEMAPLDISIRKSLITLLESEQRWDEALDQYTDLADTYHQLGNFDMSRETYNVAERVAKRVNASTERLVRIKHRLADIDQMRLDLRKAQRIYEEIVELDPNDERARRMLIDLNYRQNNQVEAVRRLDQLLGIYAKNKQINRIMQLLEELVTLYQNDNGLRSRLAAIYRQVGRKEDAIQQLDALGELQLEAGLHQDAINTIRQIIAMNPEGVDEYKRLLKQLMGGAGGNGA